MAKKRSTNNPTPENIAENLEDLAEGEKMPSDEAYAGEKVDSVEIEAENEPTPESDELTAVKAEAQKNLEGWQRTLAEFQNYKRRVEREQQDLSQRLTMNTLSKVLPIIDDFERAMANVPDDLRDNPWMNGVHLIQGKFKKLLDEHEIQIIDPAGQPFDPNLHQAIAMDDSSEHESGHVIETLQKGYISGDTLLRPALVRVAN